MKRSGCGGIDWFPAPVPSEPPQREGLQLGEPLDIASSHAEDVPTEASDVDGAQVGGGDAAEL